VSHHSKESRDLKAFITSGIDGKQGFKYRMFIPLNPEGGAAPLAPPPVPPPPLSIAIPTTTRNGEAAPQTKLRKEQTPLDLSKSPNDVSPRPNGCQDGSKPTTEAKEEERQHRELETHLNFLRVKHLEFLKGQQQQQQQHQAGRSESRCEECNINFSKHQNYLAHKKYYCSGGGAVGPGAGPGKDKTVPTGPIVPVTDEEDEDSAVDGEQPTPKVKKRKSVASPKSPARPPKVPSQPPAPHLPVSAALGLLGLAAPPPPARTDGISKEHVNLLRQQQEALLKSEALQALVAAGGGAVPPPIPPLLLQQVMAQHQQPSPKAPSPMPIRSPGAGQPASPASPHFVCDGCGIKFKSVTNLQAHQARYCASNARADDSGSLEALVKRSQQQLAASAAPPPPLGLPVSAADMMALFGAKSLEQQAKAAAAAAALATAATVGEKDRPPAPGGVAALSPPSPSASEDFCCILCGYKERSVERLKDHINMHFIGQVKKPPPQLPLAPGPPPLTAAPKNDPLRSSASSPAKRPTSSSPKEQEAGAEDSSAPLKKRIKREFEGNGEDGQGLQLASQSTELTASSPSAAATAMGPKSPAALQAVQTSNSAAIRCEPCDIGFAHLSNFLAHKKYYCQGAAGNKKEEAIAPASNGEK